MAPCLIYHILILIGDCMNQHNQAYQKLIAYKRATELFMGIIPTQQKLNPMSKYHTEDPYTCLLKLHPHLTRLLLKLIKDPMEGLRLVALRALEYILENLGCSLSVYLVHLLKFIIILLTTEGRS